MINKEHLISFGRSMMCLRKGDLLLIFIPYLCFVAFGLFYFFFDYGQDWVKENLLFFSNSTVLIMVVFYYFLLKKDERTLLTFSFYFVISLGILRLLSYGFILNYLPHPFLILVSEIFRVVSISISSILVLVGLISFLNQKEIPYGKLLFTIIISLLISVISLIPRLLYYSASFHSFLNTNLIFVIITNTFLVYSFNKLKPSITSQNKGLTFFFLVAIIIFVLELINGVLLMYPSFTTESLNGLLLVNSTFFVNYFLWGIYLYFTDDKASIPANNKK